MEYNLVNIADSAWKSTDSVSVLLSTSNDIQMLSYKDAPRKRLKEIKVESTNKPDLEYSNLPISAKSEPSSTSDDTGKFNTDVSYCCEHCGKLCKTFQRLKNHIEVVHRRTTDESNERQTFQCYICDKHSVSSEGLKRHMWIHTGEKRCVCSVCGKQFSRPELLKRHSKIHTGEEPYCCSFCGKKFVFSQHLKKHIRIHTGEKPYVCHVCSRGYANSETLRKHLDTHRRP